MLADFQELWSRDVFFRGAVAVLLAGIVMHLS